MKNLNLQKIDEKLENYNANIDYFQLFLAIFEDSGMQNTSQNLSDQGNLK